MERITLEALEFVKQNWDQLKRLARYWSKQRLDEVDDAFSDVVYSGVSASIESWRPDGGADLKTHVLGNMRFYFMKWHQRNNKRNAKMSVLSDLQSSDGNRDPAEQLLGRLQDNRTLAEIGALDAKETVQYIVANLAKLTDIQRHSLWLHDAMDWTFSEIAFQYGMSESFIRKQYQNAMRKVRQAINDHGSGGEGISIDETEKAAIGVQPIDSSEDCERDS
jgi:RNA polymerase sigma factor (sigma-70 family)